MTSAGTAEAGTDPYVTSGTFRAVEARTSLPPEPHSPGDARRFVVSTLRSWSAEPATDTAVLLVSELVTNALLHARSQIELALSLRNGELRVEVSDSSPALPRLQTYGPVAGTGRGLVLVEALSSDWGAREDGGGKSVWFTMPAAVGAAATEEAR